MKILDILDIVETTKPIASSIRNAYIDFSKMTLSLVAVVTEFVRDELPGLGFAGKADLIRELQALAA